MTFDVASFLAGVAAGTLTGGLAGVLYGLEKTADLHERLRKASKEVENLSNTLSSARSQKGDSGEREGKLKIDQLNRDLEEINEEIRRMYKKTAR